MVTVEGNDEVSTEDLKKEIRTQERTSYDASTIGADVQRMLTVYQRQGYFGTKIEPQRIELPDNRVNIVYEITEGHPTWITDIDFSGNKKFNDRTLRDEILSREHAWWRFMTQFDTFDEDRIQYDGQMLRQFYLQNGYVDFNVKNINGKFTPDREYYSVVFTVDEGAKYDFGTLSVDNPFDDIPDDAFQIPLGAEHVIPLGGKIGVALVDPGVFLDGAQVGGAQHGDLPLQFCDQAVHIVCFVIDRSDISFQLLRRRCNTVKDSLCISLDRCDRCFQIVRNITDQFLLLFFV